jgi:hypothetical protein
MISSVSVSTNAPCSSITALRRATGPICRHITTPTISCRFICDPSLILLRVRKNNFHFQLNRVCYETRAKDCSLACECFVLLLTSFYLHVTCEVEAVSLLKNNSTKEYRDVDIKLQELQTLTLEVSDPVYTSAVTRTERKAPVRHCIWRWVSRRFILCVEKIMLADNRTPLAQSETSHFTE